MLPLPYDRDAALLLGRFAPENRPGATIGGVIHGLRALSDGHGANAGAAHHP